MISKSEAFLFLAVFFMIGLFLGLAQSFGVV